MVIVILAFLLGATAGVFFCERIKSNPDFHELVEDVKNLFRK